MNDKETKFKITKEAVLRAAGKCGTAKEVLKEMFPEAFKEEWEDVTDKMYIDQGLYVSFVGGSETPFTLVKRGESFYRDNYKIENERIWRKKSA